MSILRIKESFGQVTARIASRTHEGVSYAVTLYPSKGRSPRGSSRCTCKAGRCGRQCWHVEAVRVEQVERLSEARSLYREVLTAAHLYEGANADEVSAWWDLEMDRQGGDTLAAVRALHARLLGPGSAAYRVTQMTA